MLMINWSDNQRGLSFQFRLGVFHDIGDLPKWVLRGFNLADGVSIVVHVQIICFEN